MLAGRAPSQPLGERIGVKQSAAFGAASALPRAAPPHPQAMGSMGRLPTREGGFAYSCATVTATESRGPDVDKSRIIAAYHRLGTHTSFLQIFGAQIDSVRCACPRGGVSAVAAVAARLRPPLVR